MSELRTAGMAATPVQAGRRQDHRWMSMEAWPRPPGYEVLPSGEPVLKLFQLETLPIGKLPESPPQGRDPRLECASS